MPTPPRESIRGNKPHQLQALEFSKTEYQYLVNLENFSKSAEFKDLEEFEQNQIKSELECREITYENLITRVNRY